MSSTSPRIVLIGAGKMGQAMIKGWLTQGMSAASITAIDPHPSEELTTMAQATGFALNPSSPITPADVLILAVKPQIYTEAAQHLKSFIGPSTLIMSIMAGKTIEAIARGLGIGVNDYAIVRAMPNTPAAIGRGIAGLCANPCTNDTQRARAQNILSATGKTIWVETESMIDAVTALSGSGPAYVFYLVEALAQAGTSLGLSPDLAMALARTTVEGSGALLSETSDISAAQLRINVTSPAGTTAAALDVLMAHDGLQPLLTRALTAARDRARALAH
jgi:pyrroline-5-carboxylate reductase